MSRHTMQVEVPITFYPTGPDSKEIAYPTLEIVFDYRRGAPEVGPTYFHGGLPAEAPELTLIAAKLIEGDGIAPYSQQQLLEWADDYLQSDAGYEHAYTHAQSGGSW